MAGGRGASFLRAATRHSAQPWRLRSATSGRLLAGVVIPAFDRETRNKGLLGRHSIPTGTAMILAPCSSVHTFFMKFPIDIVFVARDGRVLKVVPRCGAWRLAFGFNAFAAIELPAGAAASTGTNVGDFLELVEGPATPGSWLGERSDAARPGDSER